MPKTSKTINRKTLHRSTKRLSRSVRAKVSSLDVTDVLLIVIVLLVLYFVLVENNDTYSKRLGDVGINLDVNVGDTNLGVDGRVALDKDSLEGKLGVNIDEDRAHLIGDVDFGDNHKYGAGAYLKVNEDKYGMNLGYNSKRNKAYLNVGEIEGFSNLGYGPTNLTPKTDEVTLALFHAEWCGYCKEFMPKWEETVAQLNNTKTKNGKKIKCVAVEADKDKGVMKEYNVSGYPTIMVLNPNKDPVTFDDDRTVKKLAKFVNDNA